MADDSRHQRTHRKDASDATAALKGCRRIYFSMSLSPYYTDALALMTWLALEPLSRGERVRSAERAQGAPWSRAFRRGRAVPDSGHPAEPHQPGAAVVFIRFTHYRVM
jgi:hypothetical protein